MRLHSLEIKNYRGFEVYKIHFTPKTSILIGRNGAGKSALISAVKTALSFIFSNNKKLGNDFLSAGNPSLNIHSFADSDYRYDMTSGTTAPDASIIGSAIYHGQTLDWEMYKRSTSNAALFSTKYQDAFQTFMNEWRQNGADLPLLACFSDAFPHKPTKQTKFAIDNILKDRIPRNFGYYQWDLDTACTAIWEMRFCNQLARMLPLQAQIMDLTISLDKLEKTYSAEQLASNKEYQSLRQDFSQVNSIYSPLYMETMYVQGRLRKFSMALPQLRDEKFDIHYLSLVKTDNGQELSIVFKNGKSKLFKDLPAGYCRLYSIVFDLAYRAYILNGDQEPNGVVLIDEIDLHLHPSLEQSVVQCLREVFPEVQFIMTSHSAAVIANLDTTEKITDESSGELAPANQLVFMQDGQTEAEILPIIYGLDYNAALRDFMGSPSRNEKIKKMGDEYLTYCSLGMREEAKNLMKFFITELGADHNFIKELQEKAKVYEVH